MLEGNTTNLQYTSTELEAAHAVQGDLSSTILGM